MNGNDNLDQAIVWQAPTTESRVYQGEHPGITNAQILQHLMTKPGEWARLSSHKTPNAAKQAKIRMRKKYPDHQYRNEKLEDGRTGLFAMWPGEQTPEQ